MRRFDENGWTDVSAVMALHQPFNFLIGGRGTGKTFSALKACRDNQKCFLMIRRTQTQLENIASINTNPLKENAIFDNFKFTIERAAKGVYVVNEIDENDDLVRNLGYLASLSGMKNLRGMSFADVNVLIFDEFIPERHEIPIKNEADAFFNLYETVNRNRELKKSDPVQVLFLANANNLANPILLGFGLVNKIETMLKREQYYSLLRDRGIAIILYPDSPISEKKKETALYKALNQNSQFTEMSLQNKFSYSDTTGVISRQLTTLYNPVLKIDDITIYRNKETKLYYASYHSSGSPAEFSTKSEEDIRRLNNTRSFVFYAIMAKTIEYESYEIKSKLVSIFI